MGRRRRVRKASKAARKQSIPMDVNDPFKHCYAIKLAIDAVKIILNIAIIQAKRQASVSRLGLG